MLKPDADPIPKQLAHFEIIRRLGVGGMAEVFLAKRSGAENTFKLLVLKRVLAAHRNLPRFREMFADEANLATRLNHPNIVQVYEFQDYEQFGPLLSMEYVEGIDLGKLLSGAKAKGARVAPWVAAFVISEAAKGLHYAHERKDEKGIPLGIVHRDVSPQNILLSYEGAVKIADFGIATASIFRSEVGVLKGKFGYMSPEQARGEGIDRRSDIYALGVVLHEILTGRHLHAGLSGDDLLDAVRDGVVEPPSSFVRDIPPELDAVVMKALASHRDNRFQTARDMSVAIAMAMMQRQQLVDAATLEATIERMVSRELTSPATSDLPPADAEQEPSAFPPSVGFSPNFVAGGNPDTGAPTPAEGELVEEQRRAREVRHVALVVLSLHGFDALRADIGEVSRARVEIEVRKMFEQLAFKRGARFTWASAEQASAVVGLMADPNRSTSNAVRMAADIQEYLANASEDWPHPLEASIGIVRGIASGTRDKLGHLVHHELKAPVDFLAHVIGEATPPGKTFVAGGVYRLVHDEFLWEDAPAIELDTAAHKELPRTMRIHQLVRLLTREEREARLAAIASDLIGRESEKADLLSAYHQAVTSMLPDLVGRVVTRVLIGEMGIGKTALASAFKHELPAEAFKAQIDCSPSHSELPLGAIAELLRSLAGIGAQDSLETALARVSEAIGSTSPAAALTAVRLAELATGKRMAQYDDDDVAYVRKLVVTGIRGLVQAIAAKCPLVIIVEGLQWADPASLELLFELLDTKKILPVFVLLVTRPDERVAPYIEHLVRIELRGLRPDEQLRLVEARLGVHDGVSTACADLVPRVAGNPFFLLEMVDALLERGILEIREKNGGQVLVRAANSKDPLRALPSTLEQLIADRLLELPPEEREVVRWLAVAGGPLRIDDLIQVGRLASEEPVARLCARGTCDRREETIDFRHPIARDVAYAAIEKSAAVSMHLRLGEHLATTELATGLSAVIIARHFARGQDTHRAADYYFEAAQAARSSYQTQLAIKYYRRVLEWAHDDPARRLRAHEALEAIYRVLGNHRERRLQLTALRAIAQNSTNAQWVALALTRTAMFTLDEGFLAKCVPVSRKACEATRLTGMPGLEVEALSTLGEALRELGDVQGALAACDRALQVAKHPKVQPRIRADVLRSRGVLLRRVGRVQEAVDCYVDAIAVFRRVGARRLEARAKNALAFAVFVLERFEDSIALAVASISIDLAIGGRFQLAKTLTNIGQAYARLGDLTRAQAYLKRARDAHERYADQDARADTLIVSAEVMMEAGDFDAARSFCLDAGALICVTKSGYDEVHEKIVHALLDRLAGDFQGAVRRALEARQTAEAQALVSFHCYATAVEAAARVDIGEIHTGILQATRALSDLAQMQGSEYGLEIRVLCWETLATSGWPQAKEVYAAAKTRALEIAEGIRDPRLRGMFLKRQVVRRVLDVSPP